MYARRLLFLIGGSAAYASVADEFIPAAGGREARIALLLQGGEQWEKYVPDYVKPWIQRGVTQHFPIVPDASGTLDLKSVSQRLRLATGIFIGGGHTPTYHRLYATGPMRSLIRERYESGIPVAGVSAGALIAPETCVLAPDKTGTDNIHRVAGLGLVRDLIVGVHFTASNALPGVLEAMSLTRTKKALGIDDAACAVFQDEAFAGTLGQAVYEIEMLDFKDRAHRMRLCTAQFVSSF